VLEVLNYPEANEAWSLIDTPAKNTQVEENIPKRGRPRKVAKKSTDPLIKSIEPSLFESTGNEPNLADECGGLECASNSSIEKLIEHEKVVEPPQFVKVENITESETESSRKMGLKMAKKMVNSAINRKSLGDLESQFVITSSGKYSCVTCPKVFSAKSSFARHLDEHEGKTTCPICQHNFSTQRNMLVHIFILHYSIKISSLPGSGKWCDICKVEVTHPNHYHYKHQDWLTCPVCKEKFNNKRFMLSHLYNKHALTQTN